MVVRLELSHCEAFPMGIAMVNLGGAARRTWRLSYGLA